MPRRPAILWPAFEWRCPKCRKRQNARVEPYAVPDHLASSGPLPDCRRLARGWRLLPPLDAPAYEDGLPPGYLLVWLRPEEVTCARCERTFAAAAG